MGHFEDIDGGNSRTLMGKFEDIAGAFLGY